MDYLGEGGGVEPRGREDVGAALALEEEGEPEGNIASSGRSEGWCWALWGADVSHSPARGAEVTATRPTHGVSTLTPNRSILSSLWRGTTVTSSISQRKATSEGVRPAGKGRAIGGVGSRGPCGFGFGGREL